MSKTSKANQKKGMLLAFTGIMFITPDSLLIRLANIDSWNLIFYRGFIPFVTILIGLVFIYRFSLFKKIINNGWHGLELKGMKDRKAGYALYDLYALKH